jgi:hypothetical protein
MKKETSTPSATDVKSVLNDLDAFLSLYLTKKAPTLPDNVKEIIVKFAPYLSIIGVVFSIPGLLVLLGLNALFAPAYLLGGAQYTFSSILSIVFLVVTLVLEIMAIPGLFGRKLSAWKFIFYAALVQALNNLFHLDIFGLIIGTTLSLYFLYQIKSYYKN